MTSFKCIVVVPFYNESLLLPRLLDSLAQAKDSNHILLIGVDHLSTDGSSKTFERFKNKFNDIILLHEMSKIRCGGIPRNKGFKYSLRLIKNLGIGDTDIPIATIDADSRVSKNFVSEILKKVSTIVDGVAFPVRYEQNILLECVNHQANYRNSSEALRTLVGLDWLKYQFSYVLALNGAAETKGAGGYAFGHKNLRKLSHKQPFNKKREPVTGENNRMGIRAKYLGLRVELSRFTNHVHPRREFVSITQNSNFKAYRRDRDGAEIFTVVRETPYPIVDQENWKKYRKQGLKRAIAYLLTRSSCTGILGRLHYIFTEIPLWEKLIHFYTKRYKSVSKHHKEIIGGATHSLIFREAWNEFGEKKFNNFVNFIEELIPPKSKLAEWASKSDDIIYPDPVFLP